MSVSRPVRYTFYMSNERSIIGLLFVQRAGHNPMRQEVYDPRKIKKILTMCGPKVHITFCCQKINISIVFTNYAWKAFYGLYGGAYKHTFCPFLNFSCVNHQREHFVILYFLFRYIQVHFWCSYPNHNLHLYKSYVRTSLISLGW